MITQTSLRELLDYNPATGELLHRTGKRAGQRAGSVRKPSGKRRASYRSLCISSKSVDEHRVIWVWMTGEWPDQVDHINGDGTDNRWANLRNTTP